MIFFVNRLCFTLHNRPYPFVPPPPKLAVPPIPPHIPLWIPAVWRSPRLLSSSLCCMQKHISKYKHPFLRKKFIRSFQKRNFTQSTKCCSLNLALTAPTAQASIFRQNPADWQHWPVDNSNNLSEKKNNKGKYSE
jgi:hypothetical protein